MWIFGDPATEELRSKLTSIEYEVKILEESLKHLTTAIENLNMRVRSYSTNE